MVAGMADVQQSGAIDVMAAEWALESGRPEEACDLVDRALALTVGTDDDVLLPELCAVGVRALADRAAARFPTGTDRGEDARRADELVALLDRNIGDREADGAGATPRTVAARAESVAERSRLARSDPERWRDAAQRWEAAHEPYPAAYCRWREAEALLRNRTDRSRAAASLDLAWQVSRRLGLESLAARIRELAERGRFALPEDDTGAGPARVGADLGLTAREVEVLGHLAARCSDKEIGESLFISKKTVSVHVSNVLRKLAVANRYEAGRIGQLHGLGSGIG
jgi:DNA-binding CsgD family transcriptional regulator